MAHEQLHRKILDHGLPDCRARLIRLDRRGLDAEAVAGVGAGALELLEADERLAKQPARQVQQPALGVRGQPFRRDAGAAAESIESAVHIFERLKGAAPLALAAHRLGETGQRGRRRCAVAG